MELGGHKAHLREFFGVKQIGRLQVVGKFLRTCLQVCQRQGDVNAACALGEVKLHIAF